MGSSSPALYNMQFLVLLSAVAVAFANVHDATGDVAVVDAPAALPYVHDATGDVAVDDSPAPVAYAGYPYAGYPFAYTGYPYAGFPVAAFAGACLNNLGFAVPCAQL